MPSYTRCDTSMQHRPKYCSGPEVWLKLGARMATSLIVVCEPRIMWLRDDGVRLMPADHEDWLRFHAMFCSLLDKAGLAYKVLPGEMGSLEERVRYVLSAWDTLKEGGNGQEIHQFGIESCREGSGCHQGSQCHREYSLRACQFRSQTSKSPRSTHISL